MNGPDFSLTGRVAVITGGAGLLGIRHAEAIASAGGVPVLADIRADEAETHAADVAAAYGVPAAGVACDITRAESVQALLDSVLSRFGRVDVLVNNAANNPKVESPKQDFSRLERFIGTAMARQKRGVIVNISSEYGVIAPDQRLYRKAGLADDEQPVKPVTY